MYDNHARRSVIVLRVIPELESMSLPNEICYCVIKTMPTFDRNLTGLGK